jgi:hypothetical protein
MKTASSREPKGPAIPERVPNTTKVRRINPRTKAAAKARRELEDAIKNAK